jgi:hypothetical protein
VAFTTAAALVHDLMEVCGDNYDGRLSGNYDGR